MNSNLDDEQSKTCLGIIELASRILVVQQLVCEAS
jgi:hypothetical protein